MLGKTEGRWRMGRQRMRWLDGIIHSTDKSLSKFQENEGQGSLACCSPWGHKELDMTEQLNKNNRVNNKFLISKVYNVSSYLWSFLHYSSGFSKVSSVTQRKQAFSSKAHIALWNCLFSCLWSLIRFLE